LGEDYLGFTSVKPRVMTPQSSVNFPKIHLKRASNSGKQYKKRVMRAVSALTYLEALDKIVRHQIRGSVFLKSEVVSNRKS